MSDVLTSALSQVFLDPYLFGVVALSAVYGVFVGAVPGLTATMAVALLIPMTYEMSPIYALSAVVTLEACAIFAGDIPNALMRMPGTPSSAAYTDDVHALSLRGQRDRILGVCLVGSVAGGLFGALMLILFAQSLAGIATLFTTVEYFWFYLLGLGCAIVASRGSVLRGLAGLVLGVLLSTVGLSAAHGEARFTFDRPELYQGINFIPAMIGLFGLSEVLRNALSLHTKRESVETPSSPAAGEGFFRLFVLRPIAAVIGSAVPELWKRKLGALRSAILGSAVGILPGAGADIAAWVSYGVARRFSRNPDDYGKGSVEGTLHAATANSAALGGAWVPTMVFGIPGDSITALVIGILMMKNVRPGPEIFEKQAVLVYSLYFVFILANLALLPIGFLAIKAGGAIVRVPQRILLPVIFLFCILGAYSVNGTYFDVWVMIGMGLLGFVLDRWKIPIGPVVLGIVLGGPLEEKLVQTLSTSSGGVGVFFSRPVAAVLGVLTLALWLSPVVGWLRRRPRA